MHALKQKKAKETQAAAAIQSTSSFCANRKVLDHESSFVIHDHWHPARQLTAKWLKSSIFQVVVPILILASFFLSLAEVEMRARGYDVPVWVGVLEKTMLGLFICELGIRLYVRRQAFFSSPWNLIDAAVISVDIFLTVMELIFSDLKGPSASILRIFRVGRMIRISRVLVTFRELYVIVYGLVSAFKAIFWGSCLICVAFCVYGIIAVEVIHPLVIEMTEEGVWRAGCVRCPHAFENIGQSCLTFIQTIIAGDSWGQVAVPIIERHPWTVFIFYGVLASVQMGLMNLILMVIVDCATESRAEDIKFQAEAKRENYANFKRVLDRVGEHLDKDGNGQLTRDELIKGAREDDDFSVMLEMMDIDLTELDAVFNILDVDKSGGVSHKEFVEQFYKLKTGDTHTLLMLLKHDILTARQNHACEMKSIRRELLIQHQEMKDALSKLLRMDVSASDGKPCNEGSLTSLESLAEPQSGVPAVTSNFRGNSCGGKVEKLYKLQQNYPGQVPLQLHATCQENCEARLEPAPEHAGGLSGVSRADLKSEGLHHQTGNPQGRSPGRVFSSCEMSTSRPLQLKPGQICYDGPPPYNFASGKASNLTVL